MKINRILAAIMAVGLMFSAVLVYQRNDVENQYKSYEINMYYGELEKLASQEGLTIEQYLEMMQGVGINSMIIKEDTIQSLKQDPNYEIYTRMSGYDLIVESPDTELIQRVYNGFTDVAKEDRSVTFEDEHTLRIEGSALEVIDAPVLTQGAYGQKSITTSVWRGSTLEVVGLGYDERAIENAKTYGYEVILSPIFNADFQEPQQSMDRYFKTIDTYNLNPSHILFSGNQVLGFDAKAFRDEQKNAAKGEKVISEELEYMAENLVNRDIAVAFIESSSQGGYLETDGIQTLAKMMDYKAAGSYLTWDFIVNKFDYNIPLHHNGEEITNIFFRGITTRNVRVISIKPFVVDGRYVADPLAYKTVLDNLASRLEGQGIAPGRLETMPAYSANPLLKIPVAFGIIAAGLMALDNLFKVKKKTLYALMGLGAAATVGVYGVGILTDLFDKGFALLGAIVMPTLGICLLIAMLKQRQKLSAVSKPKALLAGMIIMIIGIIISFGGAFFEMAMLADTKYFLGMDSFAGVKISQLVPMGIALLFFVAYFGYKRPANDETVGITIKDAVRFGTDTIKMWQIAAVAIAGGVLVIFMMRSGNSGGEPSVIEALMRNFFETVFPARPRTKAIFVGIPALVIMGYWAYSKKHQWANIILVFASSIALVNTVNTFSHMKAPIYLSFYRTGAEMLVGAIIALVAIGIFELCEKIFDKYKDKFKESVNLDEL